MLADALASVEWQTFRPIECIVVDDGSTDDTPAELERWEHHWRGRAGLTLRVIRQAYGGACRARNAGLAEASGEFVQFLDSDDLLLPDKLQRSVDALRTQPGLGYVAGGRIFVDDQAVQQMRGAGPGTLPDARPPELLTGRRLARLPAQAVLGFVRRDLCRQAGGWNESLVRHQDWEFTTRLIAHLDGALRLRVPLYAVRLHDHGRIDDLRRNRLAALDARLGAALAAEAFLAGARDDLPGLAAVLSRLRWRYFKVMRQALKAGSLVHFGRAAGHLLRAGMPHGGELTGTGST